MGIVKKQDAKQLRLMDDLRANQETIMANLDYIAMMADIELEDDESEEMAGEEE